MNGAGVRLSPWTALEPFGITAPLNADPWVKFPAIASVRRQGTAPICCRITNNAVAIDHEDCIVGWIEDGTIDIYI